MYGIGRNDTLLVRLFKLNWKLIGLIFILFLTGTLLLYSAAGGNMRPWAIRQIAYFFMFLPIMLGIAVINIKKWFKLSYLIYLGTLILLILVAIKGHNSMGATRWLRLGSMNLQPSEIMKLCLVLGLAKYFEKLDLSEIEKTRYIIIPVLLVLIPTALILKQPDLGTSLILLAIGISILYLAGIQIWKFVLSGIIALTTLPFIWKFALYDYQKKRILTFFQPESDPLGVGYNIAQSKIAIGSGGFLGKGFLSGTQGQLNFLPEKQTDFIFTMLAEEFGFIGSFIVLLACCTIIYMGIKTALNSKSHFGRIIATGVTLMFFLHMFINTAMVMGMIPVVGAPLPLLSYGGTITATMLMGFGFLLNADLYKDSSLDR
jgi:rod shape determining protein RodA